MIHKKGKWVVTFSARNCKLSRRFFFRFTAYRFAFRRICEGWKIETIRKEHKWKKTDSTN